MKHPYKMVRMSLEKKNRFMDRSCRILQRESLKKNVSSPIIYGVIKNLHNVLLLFFTGHSLLSK